VGRRLIHRRTFITTSAAAAVVAAALPVPSSTKIEFPAGTRWRLYMIHNRYTNEQLARLLVWRDGSGRYEFTASDERDRSLAADRRWWCLGRLRWVVVASGNYEHHVVPI
jgi:hypothetical protein